jgi:hypothetical protein
VTGPRSPKVWASVLESRQRCRRRRRAPARYLSHAGPTRRSCSQATRDEGVLAPGLTLDAVKAQLSESKSARTRDHHPLLDEVRAACVEEAAELADDLGSHVGTTRPQLVCCLRSSILLERNRPLRTLRVTQHYFFDRRETLPVQDHRAVRPSNCEMCLPRSNLWVCAREQDNSSYPNPASSQQIANGCPLHIAMNLTSTVSQ